MIATFDLTHRCPLRCAHCYFFAVNNPAELDDVRFFDEVSALRERWHIRSAFWVGGEPLLRLGLLRRVLPLFARNAVATSGMLPIPTDLDAGLLVSIDGLQPTHDLLRGAGSYARVLKNVRAIAAGSFAISTTISSSTTHVVEELERLVDETRALGVLVGLVTGPADDPAVPDAQARERVVDALLALRSRAPSLLINTEAALQWLRPSRMAARPSCIYESRALAFDTALQIKTPCTFGPRANCAACGCPVVAEQRARQLGHETAVDVLRALFPRRQLAA